MSCPAAEGMMGLHHCWLVLILAVDWYDIVQVPVGVQLQRRKAVVR